MTMSYVNQTAIAVKKEKGEEGKNRWQLNKTNKLNQLFPISSFPLFASHSGNKGGGIQGGPTVCGFEIHRRRRKSHYARNMSPRFFAFIVEFACAGIRKVKCARIAVLEAVLGIAVAGESEKCQPWLPLLLVLSFGKLIYDAHT